jgi:hypothetical protein
MTLCDGNNIFLRNTGIYLQIHTELNPPSSSWEYQMLHQLKLKNVLRVLKRVYTLVQLRK